MLRVPAALIDGRRLPRRLQVSGGGPWYLAGPGSFERVGAGDLSYADLKEVEAELGKAILVALPLLRSLQDYLTGEAPGRTGSKSSLITTGALRRIQRFEDTREKMPPTVSSVARAAQVAILPDLGPVWVDRHRLFRPGERATLHWTEPRVELDVVRPSTVRAALREVIGGRRAPRSRRAGS